MCIRVQALPWDSLKFLSAHLRPALDMSQITCKSGSNLQNDRLWWDFSRPYRACYITLTHNQERSLTGDLWYLNWLAPWFTLTPASPSLLKPIYLVIRWGIAEITSTINWQVVTTCSFAPRGNMGAQQSFLQQITQNSPSESGSHPFAPFKF